MDAADGPAPFEPACTLPPPLPAAGAAELAALAAQAAAGGADAAREVLPRFTRIVDRHQEQPQLLDPHLPAVIPPLATALLESARAGDAAGAAAHGALVWAAASARGRKAALRFFPHAADCFEPVARLLAGAAGVAVPGSDSGGDECRWAAVGAALGEEGAGGGAGVDDRPVGGSRAAAAAAAAPPPPPPPPRPPGWPARCALLLWLAQAATIPFPMALLDPTGGGGARGRAGGAGAGGAWAAPPAAAAAEAEEPPADAAGRPPLHAHPAWAAAHHPSAPCPAAYDRLTASACGGGGDGGGSEGEPACSSTWPALARAAEAACRAALASPGADREAAVLALGRLLARPDADAPSSGRRLARFVAWAEAAATHSATAASAATTPPTDRAAADVRAVGAAAALAQVFARAERRALLPVAPAAWRAAAALLPGGAAAAPHPPGVHARRAAVKLAARVALAGLPPPAAGAAAGPIPPRVQAGTAALVASLRDRDTAVRWAAAKGLGRVAGRLVGGGGGGGGGRGSAASAAAAGAIADACLALLDRAEPDAAWHGGCLALAALLLAGRAGGGGPAAATAATAGAVPTDRLPALVAAAGAALAYDVRRGSGAGVGAHVRDAGAYVGWALARCGLPRPALAAAAAPLATRLAASAAFDREVNCRRAAAAAFQELAGRCGPDAPAFAHEPLGVAAAADFYALASPARAALRVGPALSALGGPYPAALAAHLVDAKLGHWDRRTRDLAAEALAAVCLAGPAATGEGGPPSPAATSAAALAARLAAPATSPDGRAGAAAGLAALIAAGCDVGRDTVAGLLSSLPAAAPGLARGRGGEVVREGLLALVAALAGRLAAVAVPPPSPPPAHSVLAFIDANLRHPAAAVRQAAAAALGALARASSGSAPHPPPGWEAPPPDAPLGYAAWLPASSGSTPEARRGGAAALGALPGAALAPHAAAVVGALAAAVRLEADASARDAEARASAAAALDAAAAAALPLLPGPASRAALRTAALDALLAGAADFSADRRGDVGSWVRAPAAAGAARLLVAVSADGEAGGVGAAARAAPPVLAALVRQACERLGRLRSAARRHLESVVAADGGAPPSPSFLGDARPALVAALAAASRAAATPPSSSSSSSSSPDADDGGDGLGFGAALLADPASPPALAAAAVTGLAACVGGLDAPLGRAAAAALVSAGNADGGATAARLLDTLAAAWAASRGDARLATPWLRTADAVLAGLDPGTGEAALAERGRAATLLDLTLASARGCRDPPRLGAAAGVLCHLAGLPGSAGDAAAATAKCALRSAVLLLGHAYPTVRRAAAEALCVRLVLGVPCCADGAGEGGVGAAADLLSGTAWDGCGAGARAGRAAVCAALGLAPPAADAAKENAVGGGDVVKGKDGAQAGYQALVDAVERGVA